MHIIRRHVFPNSISNIVTVATFSVADAILFLSALGFLGLGIQAPQTDWGTMLQAGTSQIQNGFWWEIFPLADGLHPGGRVRSTTSATPCATPSRSGCIER